MISFGGDEACNFFELVLKHTADEYYGKPFLLAPWEEDALQKIFALNEEGEHDVELVYLELPKKSGKTEFAAGLLLLCMVFDLNPGCQVYGAGAALRQATNVYRAAAKMVEQSPILRRRLRVLRSTYRILKRNDPDSFYAAIAADGDLSDGVNPSVVIADEIHRWKTRKQLENWDVLSLGGITRRKTLTIAITTAGVQNESPLAWRLHQKTQRIEQGVMQDPTFYGRIYGAHEDDDWTDEATWIKANPSLEQNGGFLPIEKYREKYVASLSDPEAQFAFKKYYLNLWGMRENRVVPMDKWDTCGRRPSAGKVQFLSWKAHGLLNLEPGQTIRQLPAATMQHFAKRRCWCGIDMSMTTDLTAAVFVFPCEDKGYEFLPFFWLPEFNIKKREIKDGVPYRLWAEQGFIELCNSFEGTSIDDDFVKDRVLWGSENFDLQEICYDPWNARSLINKLLAEGLTCVEIRQGYATLTAPTKKALELIEGGKFYHGNHPVMKWNASCCSSREYNDNLMFAKPERMKSSLRIDGMSASTNALQRAMLSDDNEIDYTGLRSVNA